MALSIAAAMAIGTADDEAVQMISDVLKLTEVLWLNVPRGEEPQPSTDGSSTAPSSGSISSGYTSRRNSDPTQTPSPVPSIINEILDSPKSKDVEKSKEEKEDELPELKPVRVMYEGRDILNLEANLREPSWHMWNPLVPDYSLETEVLSYENSVYYRLHEGKNIMEDYTMKTCMCCQFMFPEVDVYPKDM